MPYRADEGNEDLIDERRAWIIFGHLSESLSPELTAAMREELRAYFATHRLISRTMMLLMAVDRQDGLQYVGSPR